MGIWNAISNGEIPSIDDVRETGNNAYDGAANALSTAGSTISSGAQQVADDAEYVADGAVSLGHSAAGYGERALDTATDLVTGRGPLWDMHFDRNMHNIAPSDPSALLPLDDGDSDPATTNVGQENDEGWSLMPPSLSAFHQDDSNDTLEHKYIHPNGSEYVVYDDGDGGPGAEVTRGDIEGTYNYITPGQWEGDLQDQGEIELGDSWLANRTEHVIAGASERSGQPVGGALEWAARGAGHVAADVIPWYLQGSVRDDHVDNAREGNIFHRLGQDGIGDNWDRASRSLSGAGELLSGTPSGRATDE